MNIPQQRTRFLIQCWCAASPFGSLKSLVFVFLTSFVEYSFNRHHSRNYRVCFSYRSQLPDMYVGCKKRFHGSVLCVMLCMKCPFGYVSELRYAFVPKNILIENWDFGDWTNLIGTVPEVKRRNSIIYCHLWNNNLTVTHQFNLHCEGSTMEDWYIRILPCWSINSTRPYNLSNFSVHWSLPAWPDLSVSK